MVDLPGGEDSSDLDPVQGAEIVDDHVYPSALPSQETSIIPPLARPPTPQPFSLEPFLLQVLVWL